MWYQYAMRPMEKRVEECFGEINLLPNKRRQRKNVNTFEKLNLPISRALTIGPTSLTPAARKRDFFAGRRAGRARMKMQSNNLYPSRRRRNTQRTDTVERSRNTTVALYRTMNFAVVNITQLADMRFGTHHEFCEWFNAR